MKASAGPPASSPGPSADENGFRAARSALMGRIRSRDTKPEMAVRRGLHALGLRYRLNRAALPGKPDIVFPRQRVAVFVHGCFWHQHPGCRLASVPKTRTEYWLPKLARNVERDGEAARRLVDMGWRVVTVWECDTRRPEVLARRVGEIASLVRSTQSPPTP